MWLADFGNTESGGVTRLLYDDRWKQAQSCLKDKMNHMGFHTYFDAVGNLFGRIEGTSSKEKTILTGSHIDTVVNGGKYDGAYGIIASLLAIHYLQQVYGQPKKTLEIVSLCEEEGSRFPLAFWGSGSITGKYKQEDGKALNDANHLSLYEEMKLAEFPGAKVDARRNDLDCFVEVHIEQGGILEREQKAIGLVTHIVGQRRFTITIKGESNHAGTTPMPYRKDSMHMAAELVLYALNKVSVYEENLVATVGKLTLSPNVPNVIPNEVVFTLDIRHHQEEVLDAYCQDIFSFFHQRCLDKGLEIDISQWVDVKPVSMDENLVELSNQILKDMNIPYRKMISGAGHDAQVFGTYCPTALLFVPSAKGISHSPEEYTNIEDLKKGVIVLIELLYKLAY